MCLSWAADLLQIRPEEIPWPSLSGLSRGMTKEKIALFFNQAPPRSVLEDDGAYREMLDKEARRWLPSKTAPLFGWREELIMVGSTIRELAEQARRGKTSEE